MPFSVSFLPPIYVCVMKRQVQYTSTTRQSIQNRDWLWVFASDSGISCYGNVLTSTLVKRNAYFGDAFALPRHRVRYSCGKVYQRTQNRVLSLKQLRLQASFEGSGYLGNQWNNPPTLGSSDMMVPCFVFLSFFMRSSILSLVSNVWFYHPKRRCRISSSCRHFPITCDMKRHKQVGPNVCATKSSPSVRL